MDAETITGQQYVNTLARLIETRRELEGNEAGQKEADVAIRKMREHVMAQYDESIWARIEQEADRLLDKTPPQPRGLRRTKAGLWLP